jgi:hypothetical protein
MLCIYCDADESLSDEHIVAEGFGGDQVIRSASCEACAKITSRLEHRVLRDGFGLRLLRSALKIGRRRAKEKPTRGTIDVINHDERVATLVSLQEHPLPLSVPLFAPASGPGASIAPEDISVRGYHQFVAGSSTGEMMQRSGGREVRFKVRNYDVAFARMLAKIAFCSWVDAFGSASLDESWLPSFVLGRRRGIGRVVGTLDYALRGATDARCLHSVHLGVRSVSGSRYAVARMQLLLQVTPSATYFIIVGTVKPNLATDSVLAGWWLPRKGAVGHPLVGTLPRWVGTTLLSPPESAEHQKVLAEIRAAGL